MLSPWPNDPVDISTPGIFPRTGCPCSLEPSFLRVRRSPTGKYPDSARAAYNTGATWPLESTNLSLSSHSGLDGS